LPLVEKLGPLRFIDDTGTNAIERITRNQTWSIQEMKSFPLLLTAVLLATPAAAATDATNRAPPEKAPSAMTSTEIASYNKGLPANHPYFIRCRKLEETGSLVKKIRVCRTNEGWKQSFAQGNANARDTVESMVQGAQNSN
jgi:hypothetical protein